MKAFFLFALTTAVLFACNNAGNKEFIVNKKWRLTDVKKVPKDTSNSLAGMAPSLAVLEASNEIFEVYNDKLVRKDSTGKELSSTPIEWTDNDQAMLFKAEGETMELKLSIDKTKNEFYLTEKNGTTYVYTEIK